MVSRRKQTSLPSEQPVRFYKVIALTFLVLTLLLFGVVVFMSSKRAVITIETKATPVDVSADLTVGDKVENVQIPAVVTTTMVTVTQTISPTGSKEEPDVATGMVTLHNEGTGAQALVATTRLLSEGGILFRLKNGVSVPGNGTIQAEVYADKKGAEGNIGPSKFTIPGLAEARQKIVYATSDTSMTGGVKKTGILSQADIDDAEKSLTGLIEEETKKQLQALSSGKEAVFSVVSLEKKSSAKAGDTVSSVTVEGKGKVAVVLYDKNDLKKWSEKALQNRGTADKEVVRPGGGEPKVTLKEYNAAANQASLHVFSDGTASLSPNSKELDKSILFGKTKFEVKRYLLSLEHVHDVQVEFRPFWMQTVPHIHDHVQVIVKEVK